MDRDLVNQRWDALDADDHAMDRDAVAQRWDELEQGTFVAKPIASLEEDDVRRPPDILGLWPLG
ncbi:hypothetical protein AB5J62_03815 [Amycolatopsis sp. cg5]|uniref:hypothetical protein n=1 Tax=Amycolatopsis sp. cg5 TaxID=3238802 RepID=UPI003525CC70